MHSAAPHPALSPRARGAHRDERDPGERHRAADEQEPADPLLQRAAREDGDEQRRDVDQQRRGAGVDPALGGVQRHVVGAEPQHAAHDHSAQPRPTHHRLAAYQHHRSQRGAGHEQPGQRQGAGPELTAGVADADERRRPQAHGDQRGRQRQPAGGALSLGGQGSDGHPVPLNATATAERDIPAGDNRRSPPVRRPASTGGVPMTVRRLSALAPRLPRGLVALAPWPQRSSRCRWRVGPAGAAGPASAAATPACQTPASSSGSTPRATGPPARPSSP